MKKPYSAPSAEFEVFAGDENFAAATVCGPGVPVYNFNCTAGGTYTYTTKNGNTYSWNEWVVTCDQDGYIGDTYKACGFMHTADGTAGEFHTGTISPNVAAARDVIAPIPVLIYHGNNVPGNIHCTTVLDKSQLDVLHS